MSQSDQQQLDGATIGMFLAPKGTEDVEFSEPKTALEDVGATVEIVGSATGDAHTVNNDLEEGDTYVVESQFGDVSPDRYDALVVPGGTVGADRLRLDADAVDLLRSHIEAGNPAGVICHGPWLLVEADVVEERTVTSYPSLKTDIRNAGGDWVDREVVIDGGVVTSRNPGDLDAFCDAIVDEFASIPVEQ